ncbi:MAG TPA: SAM-dependent methyltransferase, partial [Gammaproteobacteria bacterium]|nr:SAM-dependent methyltransferase [Gammaproteobacteria bacterium]
MHSSQLQAELPPPAPDALAHSARLQERIRAEIQAHGGSISFERYMELALYAPGLGYYSAGARKFGAAGDFITAPELSPLFARCLAVQCAALLQVLGGGDILELGAGSGAMAADMLAELETRGTLPEHYWILEVSAELRDRQRLTLAKRAPVLLKHVHWLERLPETFTGVMLGNEVLDALPVVRFRRAAQGFEEYCVAHRDGELAWQLRPASAGLQSALTVLEADLPQPLAAGYSSEICPRLPPLIASLADTLTRGALLFTDYGYARAVY